MWIKTIQLKNVKSFADSGDIQLSKAINIFIGPNGSGKSAILRGAYLLQGPAENPNYVVQFLNESSRVTASSLELRLVLSDPDRKQLRCLRPEFDIHAWQPEFLFVRNQNQTSLSMRKNNPPSEFSSVQPPICNQAEPHNFIYPYFSRRKPTRFEPAINLDNENIVEEVFTHLPAKIDRLSRPRHPGFKPFEENAANCLPFPISTATHASGKEVGLQLSDGNIISVEKMGEGTPSILALLSHLSVAKGKLFLIEELENDLHPRALKSLLTFIASSSHHNQFIISTHSNIVVSHLGAVPDTRVFSLQMQLDATTQIPTSECVLVGANAENRARVLQDLGYSPSDLYLYDAYLVLEESTAERVLRDFIVPYMFPNLQGKLRLVAAGGTSKVEATFEDFHRLFVFIRVTPQYHGRAWVAIDAGPEGNVVVSELKRKFQTWPPSHFRCFAADKFESYYPSQFQAEASRVLALQNKQERRNQKGKLAESVAMWCIGHQEEAKAWFRENAKDVLALLAEIQAALATPSDLATVSSPPQTKQSAPDSRPQPG